MSVIRKAKKSTDSERTPGKGSGLKIQDSIYGVRYLGCASDLVDAGLVRYDQLPGVDGPRKKSAVYYAGVAADRGRKYPQDEHYLEIVLAGPNRFSVWKPHPREVRAAREELEILQTATELERRKNRDIAAYALSQIPESREAFRRSMLVRLDGLIEMALFSVGESEVHGFSLEFNAVQEMRAAAKRMRFALSEGVIKFDALHHDRIVSDLSTEAGVPVKKKALLHLVPCQTLADGG